MLIWSGKNYGHGRGKSGNLILHKEWEPCFVFLGFVLCMLVVLSNFSLGFCDVIRL